MLWFISTYFNPLNLLYIGSNKFPSVVEQILLLNFSYILQVSLSLFLLLKCWLLVMTNLSYFWTPYHLDHLAPTLQLLRIQSQKLEVKQQTYQLPSLVSLVQKKKYESKLQGHMILQTLDNHLLLAMQYLLLRFPMHLNFILQKASHTQLFEVLFLLRLLKHQVDFTLESMLEHSPNLLSSPWNFHLL